MLFTLLGIFLSAALAPWLTKRLPKASAWLLALVPLTAYLYYLPSLPKIFTGETIFSSHTWVPDLNVALSFSLDGLSFLFVALILGIGILILIYAGAYMRGSPKQGALLSYLLLFMGSMLGVVLSENILTLFVFWELTSISSYLLIGFNHEKQASRDGALQALLITGLGGLAMLAGLLLLGEVAGTWEFHTLSAHSEAIRAHPYYLAIVLLILAGAFTKSAQFPFHFWLPNAMAAPTPVSAYLHSATMVKAGVYLIARLTPVLGDTLLWESLLIGTGAITMVLGAWLALAQTDLKRLLAYSTISALGIMVFLLGMGSPEAARAAVVFLVAHALYKGALFMVAGAVDHASGTRDITQLKGLRRVMPLTAAAAGLSALSMVGFPPFIGFAAKEMFYEETQAMMWLPTWHYVWNGAAILASVFLVFVALRVAWQPFWGPANGLSKKAHEGAVGLWLGPLLLAVKALLLGPMIAYLPGEFLLLAAQSIVASGSFHLSLWHGWNFTLLLSAITLLSGFCLYLFKEKVYAGASKLVSLWHATPEAFYNFNLRALKWIAKVQTHALQNGRLRYYVMMIVLTTVGLTGFTLLTQFELRFPNLKYDLYVFEFVLMLLIILASTMATISRSRLGAMTGLGVVGFGVAMAFILYGAPDLAMTQILVETLVVILLVLGFHHMPGFGVLSRKSSLIRDAFVALSLGSLMTLLVLAATQVHFDATVSKYYVENSISQAHGHNVVNTILVDFRALDTMGETVVIALAGLGVLAMLKLKPKKEK